MKYVKSHFFLVFFVLFSTQIQTFAQTKSKVDSLPKREIAKEDIEVIEIDGEELEGGVFEGEELKIVRKNVVMRHKGTTLYCDSAYFNEEKNTVEAFGKTVRLTTEDGTKVTSKQMYYDGNTEQARALRDVILIDEKGKLETQQLDYDMISRVGYYYAGGKLVDNKTIVTSESGSYDTNSKVAYFRQNVEVYSKQDGETINSEYLQYNMVTHLAYFREKGKITSKDGVIYTNEGYYNTETKVSNFKGTSTIETEDYILTGDSLYYDSSYGFSKGNTELFVKEDSVFINGEVGRFWKEEGKSIVYGEPIMRNISKGDTLYLVADTLVSINNKKDSTKLLLAYNNAQIFRSDMQGKCDSIAYNRSDSTIWFYDDPVLWNEGSQLSADTIKMQLANERLDKMFLRVNAFVITQDTIENFNQLKGRYMKANFEDNEMRRIDVNGNSENIYFILEQDTLMTGMNKVECSDMTLEFKEGNKIYIITYKNKVAAKIVPPHELEDPEMRLRGFKWRIEEKPKKLKIQERLAKRQSL